MTFDEILQKIPRCRWIEENGDLYEIPNLWNHTEIIVNDLIETDWGRTEKLPRYSRFHRMSSRLLKDKCVHLELLHGRRKKITKIALRNMERKYLEFQKSYNRMAMRSDIRIVYARIGGANWDWLGKEIMHEPWFVGKLDDPFDCTYCAVFVRPTDE